MDTVIHEAKIFENIDYSEKKYRTESLYTVNLRTVILQKAI